MLVVFQSDKKLTKPTNILRNQQHAHWKQQHPTNINRWFSSKETVAGNLSIRWRVFRVKELGAPESWLEVGGFKTHLVPNKKVPFLYIAHLQLLGMWNYHDEWWQILETTLKPPIEHCSTVFHSNKSAETETSLKFTPAKKSQTTGSNLLRFSAKKMASAFEWTRHCFIPLGVSFIKVTSSQR